MDEKFTARPHIDDKEIVEIRLALRLLRVNTGVQKKWDRPGHGPTPAREACEIRTYLTSH